MSWLPGCLVSPNATWGRSTWVPHAHDEGSFFDWDADRDLTALTWEWPSVH